ncbi:MAG TPA: hypothetical protein VNO70_03510 [Blastocatellia bacterium]|nr:hypothetical protein [Blastocatellia bacterium]
MSKESDGLPNRPVMLQESQAANSEAMMQSQDIGPVGSLSICAVPDPKNWQDTQSESAYWLDLTLDGPEWGAIFHDVLRIPVIGSKPLAESQNAEGQENSRGKYMQLFQGAIPEFPLLGRIYDLYEDVAYKHHEIMWLREECLKVQLMTSNPEAKEGLRKLILACDEAMRRNTGLYLASD